MPSIARACAASCAHRPRTRQTARRRSRRRRKGARRRAQPARTSRATSCAPVSRSIEVKSNFTAGARATLPVLLAVIPFGVITGVAMVASGIPPLAAMLMSIVVFAGASMVASAQLLASSTPVLLVVLTTLIINLRFMMYSASLRLHLAHAPLRWRLLLGYLTADNVYGLMLQRYSDHQDEAGKLEYFLGAGSSIWLAWQAAVLAGVVIGAGVPASWRLDFAAPLAFI